MIFISYYVLWGVFQNLDVNMRYSAVNLGLVLGSFPFFIYIPPGSLIHFHGFKHPLHAGSCHIYISNQDFSPEIQIYVTNCSLTSPFLLSNNLKVNMTKTKVLIYPLSSSNCLTSPFPGLGI